MATGSPFGPDRNGIGGDPEIRLRIREIRFFRKIFFAFFGFYGPLGTSGSPPDGPEPPNPDPDPANPVFSKIRIFCFFDFLSLKTLQYGCIWTGLEPRNHF